MAWRIQLLERNIRRLDILTGRPTVLAAWVAPTRVVYLDLQSGTRRGDQTLAAAPDRDSEKWPTFVDSLKAPNGVVLPAVRVPGLAMQTTADGQMRLYQTRAGLSLDVGGSTKPITPEEGVRFLVVGMDRLLGLVAALDTSLRLHIYQQHLRIGIFETGLVPTDDRQPELIVSHSGTTIFASDGQRIVQIDAAGRVKQRLELHYPLGALCCTPDGRMIATVDADSNVIRIYSSGTLKPTHQRFAVDLLSDAKRTPFTASSVANTSIDAITLNNKGVLAFSMGGLVCVTNMKHMKALTATEIDAPTAPDPTTITADIPLSKPKARTQERVAPVDTDVDAPAEVSPAPERVSAPAEDKSISVQADEPDVKETPPDAKTAATAVQPDAAGDTVTDTDLFPAVRTDEIRAVVGRIAAAVSAREQAADASNEADDEA